MITLIIIISIVVWLCLDRSPEKIRERDRILYGEDDSAFLYYLAVYKKQLNKENKNIFKPVPKHIIRKHAHKAFQKEKGYPYTGGR